MPGAPNDVPFSKEANGPFRIWHKLSSGGFATAMAAEDLASSRLICLKVFMKTQLKQGATEESILKEIEVYKRLASSKESYPGEMFLMQLDRSFQTRKLICFAMVCASPLCSIRAVLIRYKSLGPYVVGFIILHGK
jgi:hypothetical protein